MKKTIFFAALAVAFMIAGIIALYGFGTDMWTAMLSEYPERIQELANTKDYCITCAFSCVVLSAYSAIRLVEELIFKN